MAVEQALLDNGLPEGRAGSVSLRATEKGRLLLNADDYLAAILEVLTEMRLEMTATRLAIQELVNQGSDDQADFLELATDMTNDDLGAN